MNEPNHAGQERRVECLVGPAHELWALAQGQEPTSDSAQRMAEWLATFREAPLWHDGSPENLQAAAEDAYEWLAYLQARSKVLRMDNLQWDKLDRCMEALRAFVRHNKD